MRYLGYSFIVLLLAFVVFTAGETQSQEQERRGADDRRTTYTPQLNIPEESREASRLQGPPEIPAVITPGLVSADRTERRRPDTTPEFAPEPMSVPSGDSRVIRYDLDDGTYDLLELPGPNTGIHRMRVVSDAENFAGAYVYLAYVHENDDGDYLLYFTRSTNSGDTWSTPVLIGNVNPSYYNDLVDVGLEWRSGTGSRVWLSWVGGPGDDENLVHVSTSTFGTGWSTPAIIDSVDDFSKLGPVVAAFEDNVLIAFQRQYSATFDDDIIRGIYSDDNGASWTSYFIDSGFSEIRMPWVSNDGTGNFYVTYNDEGEIYARVDDNPNVTASRTLISSGVDADDLMYTAVSGVKGTDNEGAAAVWSATVPGEGDLDIYGNFYDPVDEWDDQFSISQWTDIDLTHPHITGDGDGNLYMIHQTGFSPSEADLWMSEDGGETWTFLEYFIDMYRPTLTYANGYLFVAYYQEPEPELDPEIVVTPESLSELLEVGETSTQMLTISNVGDGDLQFSISWGEVPLSPLSIPAGRTSGGVKASPGSIVDQPAIDIDGDDTPSAIRQMNPEQSRDSRTIRSSAFSLYDNVLYDNGPLVNSPGTGPGGADESILQNSTLGMNSLGFNHSVTGSFRVADDFEVDDPDGWTIHNFVFYGYETNSGTTSTFTHVNLQIWDGVPGEAGSNVIFGDDETNRLVHTEWANIYRISETTPGTARPVMILVASAGIYLEPGTYWVDWQTDGTVGSGPWAPPITINGETTTGDALQYQPTPDAYVPILDSGTNTPQGLPFLVLGNVGADWLSVSPVSGTVSPAGSQEVEVTFDATGLEIGVYDAEINIASNDPNTPVVTVPVTLTVDEATSVTEPDVPTVYSLQQNYPNPFNPSTTIRYGLPERSTVKIEIFNTLGQRVATILNAELEAGFHNVEWYSGRAASGMYFYRLEAVSLDDPSNRFVEVKSMMLLK